MSPVGSRQAQNRGHRINQRCAFYRDSLGRSRHEKARLIRPGFSMERGKVVESGNTVLHQAVRAIGSYAVFNQAIRAAFSDNRVS